MSNELADLRLCAEDLEMLSRIYCELVFEEEPSIALISEYIWKVTDASKKLLDAAWAYDSFYHRSIGG